MAKTASVEAAFALVAPPPPQLTAVRSDSTQGACCDRRLFFFYRGDTMQNLLADDQSDALDALHAELKEKLPEEQLCELTTIYGLLDILVGGNSIDMAEHLFHDHNDLYAGEMLLAFLRFLDSAGRVEAARFHEHDIRGINRFDVGKNAQTLAEFQANLAEAQVAAAMLEGASHVKH